MTTDTELANAVVAHGVGYMETHYPANTPFYYHADCTMPMTADDFVTKWQVAGAMMEKHPHPMKIQAIDNAAWVEITIYNPGGDEEAEPLRIVAHQESLPRAIIEACCEALKDTES